MGLRWGDTHPTGRPSTEPWIVVAIRYHWRLHQRRRALRRARKGTR